MPVFIVLIHCSHLVDFYINVDVINNVVSFCIYILKTQGDAVSMALMTSVLEATKLASTLLRTASSKADMVK